MEEILWAAFEDELQKLAGDGTWWERATGQRSGGVYASGDAYKSNAPMYGYKPETPPSQTMKTLKGAHSRAVDSVFKAMDFAVPARGRSRMKPQPMPTEINYGVPSTPYGAK